MVADRTIRIDARTVLGAVLLWALAFPTPAVSQSLLEATPSWHADGGNSQASLGYSMAVCDVNGDGVSDVFLGSPLIDGAAGPSSGAVYGFYGSSSSLPAEPSWSTTGSGFWVGRGQTVACAGDVDGDGYGDLLVADANFNPTHEKGRVTLFRGSADGLGPTPAWRRSGNEIGDDYGLTLASMDVDRDGFSDAIVGADNGTAGEKGEGLVFVYRGGPEGLQAPAATRFEMDRAGAGVGAALQPAGDVDVDGLDDLLVGYHGADASGLVLLKGDPDGGLSAPAWEWTLPAGADLTRDGIAAGDVNGDGYADVLVASDGAVRIFYGSPEGPSSLPEAVLEGVEGSGFGSGLAVADVDGDGFADVAVGSSGFTGELSEQGRVDLYPGGAEGPGSAPAWQAVGDREGAHFGGRLAFADVDGDGLPDLLVAATSYTAQKEAEGRVYLYLGLR